MDIYFILTSTNNIQLRASVKIKTMLTYMYHHSRSFLISGKTISHFSNVGEAEFGMFSATKKADKQQPVSRKISFNATFVRPNLFADTNAVLYWI